MPNMADITVKKADGTTDITYTSLTPSSGDRVPAQWRVESLGTVAGNRPTLVVSARYSQDRKARLVEGRVVLPETFTDSTTGIISVRNREMFSFNSVVHLDTSDSVVSELAAQSANLLKSALLQSVIKTGFAPS